MKKQHLWALVSGLVLSAFTTYVLLDTFVIPRTYAVVTTKDQSESTSANSDTNNTSSSGSNDTSSETTGATSITDTSYSDDNIQIKITTQVVDDTTVYVADIQVSDISYLQAAFANASYGKNVKATTSDTAESVNAILAVNGDFYGARNEGYVIRNGVLYRSDSSSEDQEDLVIYKDGTFENITEGSISAQELIDKGAWQVLSFGPALISNGSVQVSTSDEVDQAMASNPRTAIGFISSLHYVMVVADGRTSESAGLSLYNLASFMKTLGVQTAYNLDGGGSSTMYFNGEVINKPTTDGNTIVQRKVSDIVYIGY